MSSKVKIRACQDCIINDHLEDVVNVTWNYAGRIESKRDEIMNAVLGLGGEAGEVVDLHKKLFFHKAEIDRRDELVGEIGDVFYYLIKLMDLHEIGLEEALESNRAKLMKRHAHLWEAK